MEDDAEDDAENFAKGDAENFAKDDAILVCPWLKLCAEDDPGDGWHG